MRAGQTQTERARFRGAGRGELVREPGLGVGNFAGTIKFSLRSGYASLRDCSVFLCFSVRLGYFQVL